MTNILLLEDIPEASAWLKVQIAQVYPSAVFHDDTGDAAPRNLHLTIAGNADTSVVVQWSTNDATRATEVRFGDSPTKLDKIAAPTLACMFGPR